ncbi:MAG: glycosyltransferase family 2 protein [Candidatus Avilachnospira sp.]|jgi:glycosyltransferase involved in cell wall biosynthesis
MGKESQYEDVCKAEGGEINRPFFSIVVPAYNAGRYLPDIIECIKNQTCGDYEAIIVDDGSKDGTLPYLENLNEEKIRYIHKELNEGLSAARNTGMSEAKGEYIFFWDADDKTDRYTLEKIREILSSERYDLVIYGTKELYYNDKGKLIYSKEVKPDRFSSDIVDEIHREAVKLEAQTLLGYAWNKCYNLDLLKENKLEFKKIKLIEDIDFNIDVFDRITSLYVMDAVPYEYMKRNSDSLTEGRIEGYFKLNSERIRKLMEYYKKWGCYEPEGKTQLAVTYGRYIYSAVERSISENKTCREKIRRDVENIFNSNIYDELILKSKIDFNGYQGLMLKTLQGKNISQIIILGKIINVCKRYMKPIFFRLAKKQVHQNADRTHQYNRSGI